MRATQQAIQTIWAMQRGRLLPATHSRTLPLISPSGVRYDVDVIEPPKKVHGVIMLVHGMTVLGNRDERLIVLGHALAQAGFRVIAPDFPCIRTLTISEQQIHRIGEAMEAVLHHPELAPRGRLSLLAPSFSGALSLSAASLPHLAGQVDAVCAIGAFSHVESVIEYLMKDAHADPYGRYIVLKKLLAATDLAGETFLLDALDAAIQENINASRRERGASPTDQLGQPALSVVMERFAPEQRQLAQRLFDDAAFRIALLEQASPVLAPEFQALNVANRLDTLKARVFLLHGSHDRVIPRHQSERLNAQMAERRKSASLVVSSLISHGDTQFNYRMVREVGRMVNGFAFFFRHASGRQ